MDKKDLLDMYKDMFKIRCFDKECVELKYRASIQSGFHSYWGQEAVAVGVCKALGESDYILSTHRPQGHALAKGCESELIFAEMMGRITGVSQGKGGPMSITNWKHQFLCTSIVGSGIPLATGVGLAIKMKGSSKVAACFFGDGATNTGAFHEGLNLASIWKLPIIFICENNQYGEATPISKAVAISNLSKRAESYGIEGKTVDGNDVVTVYETTLGLVEKARKGECPSFLEAITYRIRGHYEGDPENYRTKEEVKEWGKKCPLLRTRKYLLEGRYCSEEKLFEIEKEAEREVLEAKKWALAQPFPTSEVLTKDIYEGIP